MMPVEAYKALVDSRLASCSLGFMYGSQASLCEHERPSKKRDTQTFKRKKSSLPTSQPSSSFQFTYHVDKPSVAVKHRVCFLKGCSLHKKVKHMDFLFPKREHSVTGKQLLSLLSRRTFGFLTLSHSLKRVPTDRRGRSRRKTLSSTLSYTTVAMVLIASLKLQGRISTLTSRGKSGI
ncbi:uncharacterized protein LOC123330956 isoform X3 [Bubalus bubalis]|uniref:uncharacterized protein LOC123330956 isoform X3 n=1 Tax=Bubalus bubalis TaxID=89462 RepID=UPI001D0F4F44|nr:uncharacterized protein LOC123330956 isoform X3 [Bubalus bubalis]XP_044789640.1 uncharacterized protein LOC123330956 isoform X3 [Bubalus bubalis]XP_044789641.1 uncharacterized protein LOC123330956 isoform X3 [Bubalus bubalis]XP_044789643.1 uncharacterized protein LOC123330956 isoform X3 [Bubalus bubalis]